MKLINMVVSFPKLESPQTSLPVSLAFFQLLEHSMFSFTTELFNVCHSPAQIQKPLTLILIFCSHIQNHSSFTSLSNKLLSVLIQSSPPQRSQPFMLP